MRLAHIAHSSPMSVDTESVVPIPADDHLLELARAIQAHPDDAITWCHFGIALAQSGRTAEAEACLRNALCLRPDDAGLLNNLGTLLTQRRAYDEAGDCYRRSLALRPQHLGTLRNYASLLFGQGLIEEAVSHYRQAVTLAPADSAIHSDLLFALARSAGIECAALYAEHRAYAERHEAPLRASLLAHPPADDPERVLKVGFVSGDFRRHSVSSFFEPILRHLAPRTDLALFAYSNSRIIDDVTARLKAEFVAWRAVADLADDAMAEQVRRDGIDILVDLSGHTAGNRLPVFARKPAPIQASWLGYPGTTGLDAMDYYIGDCRVLPRGLLDDQFSERIVRLAWGVPFCWSGNIPPASPLPARACGHLTFASFNHPSKLNQHTLSVWGGLLDAIPGARLLICGVDPGKSRSTISAACERAGLPAGRVEFRQRVGFETYLRLHHEVDICLDALPYNGGTTTLHALRMGVPTLTIAGETMPARVGVGLLESVGLGEFAANDRSQFVGRGISWASRLEELAEIRRDLPGRLEASGIGQPDRVADCMARAFRAMWARRCAGQVPVTIDIDAGETPPRPARQGTIASCDPCT